MASAFWLDHKNNCSISLSFQKSFVSLPLEHRLIVLKGQKAVKALQYVIQASAEARRCLFCGLNNTALMLLVISGNVRNSKIFI